MLSLETLNLMGNFINDVRKYMLCVLLAYSLSYSVYCIVLDVVSFV